jgi:hypothetical protein
MEEQIVDKQLYEFTREQNKEVIDLAHKLKWTGILSIIFGSMLLIISIMILKQSQSTFFVLSLIALFIIVTGFLVYKANNPFRLIVHTEGNDIDNLMLALKKLIKVYKFQFVVLIAAIICIGFALQGYFFTVFLHHK